MSESVARLRAVARRASTALCLAVCLAATARAGTPAPPDAATLLGHVREAGGAAAWRRVVAVEIDGRLSSSGLDADYHADDDPRGGRFDHRRRFPLFEQREVWDGRTDWRQDNSGGVHRLDGAFATRRHATDAWLVRRGWLLPDAGGAWFGPTSDDTVDGRRLVALEAVPVGGQPVRLMFDATNYDLARIERVMPTSVAVDRYDDYRDVDGVRLPFSITSGDEDDSETLRVATYRLRRTGGPHRFVAPPVPDDWTLSGPSASVPFDLRNGTLTIEAKIDGQGPFRFIFDTGGHAIVSPALADALHLKTSGAGVSGGAGEGTLTQRYTRVATVEIGGLTLKDQHFYVLDLGYPTFERGADAPLGGLFGVELLERLAVRFDYPARRVTFTPFATHRFDPAAVRTAVRFDDDIPLVDARLDGQDGVFAVDTGNASTIVVQSLWAARHGLADDLKHGVETASFGAGGLSRNWISRVDRFEIGGRRLERVPARYADDRRGAFSSRTEAGNVGTDVLANFAVDFDYRRGLVGWTFVPGQARRPFNRAGMRALKDRPGDFVVTVVATDSPAAAAGVVAKDRIVAVDGVPSAVLSGADINETFERPPGTQVRLDLVRDGQPIAVTVTLREMLP